MTYSAYVACSTKQLSESCDAAPPLKAAVSEPAGLLWWIAPGEWALPHIQGKKSGHYKAKQSKATKAT